jgi:hypothetical protein
MRDDLVFQLDLFYTIDGKNISYAYVLIWCRQPVWHLPPRLEFQRHSNSTRRDSETDDCARHTNGSLLHIRIDHTESDKISWHQTTLVRVSFCIRSDETNMIQQPAHEPDTNPCRVIKSILFTHVKWGSRASSYKPCATIFPFVITLILLSFTNFSKVSRLILILKIDLALCHKVRLVGRQPGEIYTLPQTNERIFRSTRNTLQGSIPSEMVSS